MWGWGGETAGKGDQGGGEAIEEDKEGGPREQIAKMVGCKGMRSWVRRARELEWFRRERRVRGATGTK